MDELSRRLINAENTAKNAAERVVALEQLFILLIKGLLYEGSLDTLFLLERIRETILRFSQVPPENSERAYHAQVMAGHFERYLANIQAAMADVAEVKRAQSQHLSEVTRDPE